MRQTILQIFLENDLAHSSGRPWLSAIDRVLSGEIQRSELRGNVTFQIIEKETTCIGDVFDGSLCSTIEMRTIDFRQHIVEWTGSHQE